MPGSSGQQGVGGIPQGDYSLRRTGQQQGGMPQNAIGPGALPVGGVPVPQPRPTLPPLTPSEMTAQASQRGRDWQASIPQAVQPAGPADTMPVGSTASGYNQAMGNALGSQYMPSLPGPSSVGSAPPSAEQQRQMMAQLMMARQMGQLQVQNAVRGGL